MTDLDDWFDRADALLAELDADSEQRAPAGEDVGDGGVTDPGPLGDVPE